MASVRSNVLWIGGAQWAGKSSVAQLLAERHGLIHYAYDFHDARSHAERARAQPDRFPYHSAWLAALGRNPDDVWVKPTPADMAESARHSFVERFTMVLEDLAGLPAGAVIFAEGWGLRPELVAPLLDRPERAVFLVPSEEFRQHQLRALPRAQRIGAARISDPARAQRNRVERDRLQAQDVVDVARRLGLWVVMVDGARDVSGLARWLRSSSARSCPPGCTDRVRCRCRGSRHRLAARTRPRCPPAATSAAGTT